MVQWLGSTVLICQGYIRRMLKTQLSRKSLEAGINQGGREMKFKYPLTKRGTITIIIAISAYAVVCYYALAMLREYLDNL